MANSVALCTAIEQFGKPGLHVATEIDDFQIRAAAKQLRAAAHARGAYNRAAGKLCDGLMRR